MPYADLVHKLGLVATQVSQNPANVNVTYKTASPDDLDTRLLRANLIKGLVEHTTSSLVNLVNADLIADQRKLSISETKNLNTSAGVTAPLISNVEVRVSVKNNELFPSAICNKSGEMVVGGKVKDGEPYLTKLGQFDMDVHLNGALVLCRHQDQPGVIGAVGTTLAENDINVTFMSVGRTGPMKDAVMAIGVDDKPTKPVVDAMAKIPALKDVIVIDLPHALD